MSQHASRFGIGRLTRILSLVCRVAPSCSTGPLS